MEGQRERKKKKHLKDSWPLLSKPKRKAC